MRRPSCVRFELSAVTSTISSVHTVAPMIESDTLPYTFGRPELWMRSPNCEFCTSRQSLTFRGL